MKIKDEKTSRGYHIHWILLELLVLGTSGNHVIESRTESRWPAAFYKFYRISLLYTVD